MIDIVRNFLHTRYTRTPILRNAAPLMEMPAHTSLPRNASIAHGDMPPANYKPVMSQSYMR
jgi:hypothetical protein